MPFNLFSGRFYSGRAGFVFIFITVLLDMLVFGLISPVLPKLVEEMLGGDLAYSAKMFGLMGMLWALMQFVFSPVLGVLSDRFGRRPIIILSNFGLALSYVLTAFAPSIALLLVARIISGITSASFGTANAYIADVTPPEERAAKYGILGIAFGVGFIAGPALGGIFGHEDPRLPFWIAAALSAINGVYGLFILPESLDTSKRMPLSWRKANPAGSLSLLLSHKELAGLSTSYALSTVGYYVLPSVFVLYAGHRYGWGAREVGLTLSLVGIATVIAQAGLVKPIVRLLGERKTLIYGLACGGIGFSLYGWAPAGVFFLIGIPVMALWGVSGPSEQALMTSRVSESQQGQLQGALAAIGGIGGMIGPLVFTNIFAWSITTDRTFDMPGAAFYAAAAMQLLALVIVVMSTRPRKNDVRVDLDT